MQYSQTSSNDITSAHCVNRRLGSPAAHSGGHPKDCKASWQQDGWLQRGGDNKLQGNLRWSWPSGTQMHNPLLLCKTSVFQKQFQGKQEGSLQCACFIMLPSWTPCFHVKLPLTQSSAQPEFQHGEVTNLWLLDGLGREGDLPNGTLWWSSSIKKRSPMVIWVWINTYTYHF